MQTPEKEELKALLHQLAEDLCQRREQLLKLFHTINRIVKFAEPYFAIAAAIHILFH